jgi:phosphoglycerol transferase MdoB-like AlkP superfamily enzyme
LKQYRFQHDVFPWFHLQHGWFKRLAWSIALGVILPNLLLHLISLKTGLVRPILNIDYILPVILWAYGWRFLSGILLALVFLLDILVCIQQVFPFVRLSEVLYLSKFVLMGPDYYQWMLAFSVTLLILLEFVLIFKGKHAGKKESLYVGLFLIFICWFSSAWINTWSASLAEQNRNQNDALLWNGPHNTFTSSGFARIFEFSSTEFAQEALLRQGQLEPAQYQGATHAWHEQLKAHRPLSKRLLLIVNESWGYAYRESVQRAVLKHIEQQSHNFLFYQQGHLPFVGATVAGELRELCRLHQTSLNLQDVETGFEPCLANRLKAQGYQTIGMHGAFSTMYDRNMWYPRAGFQKTIFYESKQWPHRCYSFPGACDADLFAEIKQAFKQTGPVFFYWMTLNTHADYDLRDLKTSRLSCAAIGVDPNTEGCRNLQLQAQFFDHLADVLKSPEMHDVEVIVVGDHAPPMFDISANFFTYKSGDVAWLHLKTRKDR